MGCGVAVNRVLLGTPDELDKSGYCFVTLSAFLFVAECGNAAQRGTYITTPIIVVWLAPISIILQLLLKIDPVS